MFLFQVDINLETIKNEVIMEENTKFHQEENRENGRRDFHRGQMGDEKRWEIFFDSWGKDCPEEMKNDFKEMHKALEAKLEEVANMRKEFSEKWKNVLGEKFPEREHMMNDFGRHGHGDHRYGDHYRGDNQHGGRHQGDRYHGGMHGRFGFTRHEFGSDH